MDGAGSKCRTEKWVTSPDTPPYRNTDYRTPAPRLRRRNDVPLSAALPPALRHDAHPFTRRVRAHVMPHLGLGALGEQFAASVPIPQPLWVRPSARCTCCRPVMIRRR